MSARVCIERTLDVPQAASGPLVTPTKPILSTELAAKADNDPAFRASTLAAPKKAVFTNERLFMALTPPGTLSAEGRRRLRHHQTRAAKKYCQQSKCTLRTI